jgi:hypothetical protein
MGWSAIEEEEEEALDGGVASYMHRQLYPLGISPRYPFDRKLGGPQSQSGCCGVEKNLLPLRGIETCRPARSPSLYRLRYPGSYNFICKHNIW